VSCGKTAELIQMLFGFWTWGGSKACIRWESTFVNLANTSEPSMSNGDAAFLSNYFDHLLNWSCFSELLQVRFISQKQSFEICVVDCEACFTCCMLCALPATLPTALKK